jgi:CspA family cold shock protein
MRGTVMATGTVKWFSNVKGYGFVNTDENENEDIFVHYSAIEMDGYKKLTSGQKIEFDIDVGPKGLQAQNIRSVNN